MQGNNAIIGRIHAGETQVAVRFAQHRLVNSNLTAPTILLFEVFQPSREPGPSDQDDSRGPEPVGGPPVGWHDPGHRPVRWGHYRWRGQIDFPYGLGYRFCNESLRSKLPFLRHGRNQEAAPVPRFHLDRTPGSDCDHRHPRRDVVAGPVEGQAKGTGHRLPQQPAPDRHGLPVAR